MKTYTLLAVYLKMFVSLIFIIKTNNTLLKAFSELTITQLNSQQVFLFIALLQSQKFLS